MDCAVAGCTRTPLRARARARTRTRTQLLLLTLLIACARTPGDASSDPLDAERRQQEALCGEDASCIRRLQLRASGTQANDAPPTPEPDRGPFFCFEGGHPGDPVGACEKSRSRCEAAEAASRDAGVPVSVPCRSRPAAACLGVVKGDTAIVFCAPTPETCQRMEQKLATGDYEPLAPCEVVHG